MGLRARRSGIAVLDGLGGPSYGRRLKCYLTGNRSRVFTVLGIIAKIVARTDFVTPYIAATRLVKHFLPAPPKNPNCPKNWLYEG